MNFSPNGRQSKTGQKGHNIFYYFNNNNFKGEINMKNNNKTKGGEE